MKNASEINYLLDSRPRDWNWGKCQRDDQMLKRSFVVQLRESRKSEMLRPSLRPRIWTCPRSPAPNLQIRANFKTLTPPNICKILIENISTEFRRKVGVVWYVYSTFKFHVSLFLSKSLNRRKSLLSLGQFASSN